MALAPYSQQDAQNNEKYKHHHQASGYLETLPGGTAIIVLLPRRRWGRRGLPALDLLNFGRELLNFRRQRFKPGRYLPSQGF
jgi:hypothetical protein